MPLQQDRKGYLVSTVVPSAAVSSAIDHCDILDDGRAPTDATLVEAEIDLSALCGKDLEGKGRLRREVQP